MKGFFKRHAQKLKVFGLTCAFSILGAMAAFAAEGDVVTAADWESVITALTTQINVTTVVAVLATFVAAGIGLVFMWWGLRKAIRTIMGAFRGGKLSV